MRTNLGTDGSQFSTKWILENVTVLKQKHPEGMTTRQIYYSFVSMGMPNDFEHYNRLCGCLQ
jgi:hypothetical protein